MTAPTRRRHFCAPLALLARRNLVARLAELGVPVVAQLRDTQNYVQLAAHGLTLWDVAPSRVERDLPQWQQLTQWIAQA